MLLCDLSSLRLARGAGTCSTETRARERGLAPVGSHTIASLATLPHHRRARGARARRARGPSTRRGAGAGGAVREEGARCGRICRDLDLSALIEDDNGMELLVAGQIVRLDLSIRQAVFPASPLLRF
eukprot:tig00000158_g10140.t1